MSADLVAGLRQYHTEEVERCNLLAASADEIERLQILAADYGGQLTVERTRRLQAELERDAAVQESARYRWLKSRIAPTIIQRIDASLHAWPPDRLDEVIDARMRPVDVPARSAMEPCTCSAHPEPHFHQAKDIKAI